MPPHREDFARWRDDPVTRWVLAAHLQAAADQQTTWQKVSWEEGHANPALLQELRVRADAYRAIGEMTYEDVCSAMGEEPRDE